MADDGEDPLDAWSWVHAAAGCALAIAGVPRRVAWGLVVGYEAVEAGLRRVKSGGGVFAYESWRNIAADIVVGGAAYEAWRLAEQAASRKGDR